MAGSADTVISERSGDDDEETSTTHGCGGHGLVRIVTASGRDIFSHISKAI